MVRWAFLFLLLLNLGVAFWGWSRDRPLEAPMPALPEAPEEIRLRSELTRTSDPAAEQDTRAALAAGATRSEDSTGSASSTDEASMGLTRGQPAATHPDESTQAK